jgi:hypothetical protein
LCRQHAALVAELFRFGGVLFREMGLNLKMLETRIDVNLRSPRLQTIELFPAGLQTLAAPLGMG